MVQGMIAAEKDGARGAFGGDLWGGLAAMLVALPASIAFGVAIFAPLAGSLAAEGALAGILGATALGLVAPAFGGTTRLISAPCAPAAAVLSALATSFTAQGVAAESVVILLGMIGLLAGGLQIALGMAGVGRLIRFIPYPVVSGYLSGVGLIIIGSQIPGVLGAPAGATLFDALRTPSAWAWQSLVVGGLTVAVMLAAPRFSRTVPATIVALSSGVGGYLLLAAFDGDLLRTTGNPLLVGELAHVGGDLIDAAERNWWALRSIGLSEISQVLAPALALAALLSIDTLKTCVVLDALTRTHHDSDRELVGQGLGNLASALIGGVPGAGTMGASLINVGSGGTTRRSGLFAGGFSLLAFLALAPLIAWVPIAALAGILIVIGARMIDRHSLSYSFSPATRLDFAVIMAVILVAIFGNLVAASAVGVALAILLFIREQTRSSVVRSRLEGSELLSKRAALAPGTASLELASQGIMVFELQGSLFFGTASQLQVALESECDRRQYLILSMRRVQSLDVTATHVLEQVKGRMEERGAHLVFCDIPRGLPSGLKMKRYLKDTGVLPPSSKAFAFRELADALDWVESRVLAEAGIERNGIARDLRQMAIASGQPDDTLAELESALILRKVKAGKRVFKAGPAGDELFLVRRGTVKLTLPVGKKGHYHLATAGPGDIIGGIGFIEASGHAADALALTEVEVYVLPRDRFLMLAERHRSLALAIYAGVARNLADRLRAAVGEIQALRR